MRRREFLGGAATFLSLENEAELVANPSPGDMAEVGKEDLLGSDIYFNEGSLSNNAEAVCNNGWIIFEDYVL